MNYLGTPQSWSINSNRYTYTGREWDDSSKLFHFRARWYEPILGRFVGRDPLEYVQEVGLYNAHLPLHGVDPFGEDWHHLLSWHWVDEFDALGFDINSPEYGWMLSGELHRRLHPAWNDDWEEFFEGFEAAGKCPTRDDVESQLVQMLADPRYWPILEQGKQATTRAPREFAKRGWTRIRCELGKLKSTSRLRKGKKFLEIMGALGIADALADPAFAVCGGCDEELRQFINKLDSFGRHQNMNRCMDAAEALRQLLKCIGTDESLAALQYIRLVTEICAPLGCKRFWGPL
jgi:RHS repeat-associated protein